MNKNLKSVILLILLLILLLNVFPVLFWIIGVNADGDRMNSYIFGWVCNGMIIGTLLFIVLFFYLLEQSE